MKVNQLLGLKKIIHQFDDDDYRLTEQVVARHKELDQAIPVTDLNKVFEVLLGPRYDVRRDVLEAAMGDVDFQILAADMINQLAGFVARYDAAYQIYSARHAA